MKQEDTSIIKAWVLAARPKTLWAALSPVLLGGAFAFHVNGFSLVPFGLALACSVLFQVLANFANDYFDGVKKIDTEERLGPPRMVALGLIKPRAMVIAISLLIGLLLILGLLLFWISGWPVLIIGLAAIISALFYSGGPFPYASRALGDLFVFVFFGPVAVVGSYYVQVQSFSVPATLASLGTGFWITAILVVNNYRDREGDKKAGKNTLAVVLGEKKSRVYYRCLLFASFLTLPALFGFGFSFPVFLPLTILPIVVELTKDFAQFKGRELNEVLARTSFWGFVYSALLALAVVLDYFVMP